MVYKMKTRKYKYRDINKKLKKIMNTKTQKMGVPGIVTITIPAEALAAIRSGEAFPLEMATQPGLCYDLSTLQILCGARRTWQETELVMDEDISMGIQMAITTLPAQSSEDTQPLTLMIYKE